MLHHADEAVALQIAQAQAGDKTAFAAIYRQHHRRIYALCLRMLGDNHQAEELTQEAFVLAWRKLGSFRGESAFSTWLHRLTVNLVISWQRRNRPWLQRVINTGDEELPETPVHETPGESRDLETAISTLPERARQAFVLVDVEGYTHEEAAGHLGMAVGTCKAHVFRARERLRGMLS